MVEFMKFCPKKLSKCRFPKKNVGTQPEEVKHQARVLFCAPIDVVDLTSRRLLVKAQHNTPRRWVLLQFVDVRLPKPKRVVKHVLHQSGGVVEGQLHTAARWQW